MSAGRCAAAAWLSILCLSALAGCGREPTPSDTRAHAEKIPQQVLRGVKLRQTSVRGLLWVLNADSGIAYGADEPTRLRRLTVRFYDGQPDVRSVLTSRRGEVDDKTHSLLAQDSVLVVTPQGEKLQTQSLRWDPAKNRIRTDDFFTLTRGHDVLTGIGIDADPDLVHYVVHKQVRAEMRDESNDQLREALDGDSTAGRSGRGR